MRFFQILIVFSPFFLFERVPQQPKGVSSFFFSPKDRAVKWTPRRESEGDSRMTSSPPQGLAPVTTVHEETRAASGGAALTQQAEEANAVGTEEFATNRRGGKRKRDATQYYRLLSDEGKGVFQRFIEYCKTESIVTDGSVDQYARYASRYLYFLEQTTSAGLDDNGFVHHISEARFDAFVEWYGKRAEEYGYADNDQKTPASALSHLLRMFLEQDDEEEASITTKRGSRFSYAHSATSGRRSDNSLHRHRSKPE